MPYVKLDCGILDSTLWYQKDQRDLFITALLMARPHELTEPVDVIQVESLEPAGWTIPPGWYGLVEAAGPGIVNRSGLNPHGGMLALEALCSPDPESRSQDWEGRRMGRVDGGYIILNYDRYRTKDHTAADRARRYRARLRNGVTTLRHAVTHRNVTQAEAKAEAEANQLLQQDADDPGTDPRATAIAKAIRSHVSAITDPDEAAERLLGVAPLHAEGWWLAASIKDAAAELETGCNYDTAIRKLRAFVKNANRAPKVHDDGPRSEAEHLARKRKLAAEARADREREARERAEAVPVAGAVQSVLAALGAKD